MFIDLIMRALRYFLSPYILAIWALLVVGAVVTAPFGTYAPMALGARAVFWAVLAAAGIFLGYITHVLCDRALRHRGSRAAAIGEVLIFASLLSPLAYAMIVNMSDQIQAGTVTMARVSVFVLVAVAMIRALRRILQKGALLDEAAGMPGVGEAPQAPAEPKEPRLLRRLPDGARGAILHLSARDHFVTVETTGGAHDLRMRLRDAIDEMDSVEGLRTHRSHWVAREAIVDVRREEGRVFLVLENGREVPVSRKYRADLEEAGVV